METDIPSCGKQYWARFKMLTENSAREYYSSQTKRLPGTAPCFLASHIAHRKPSKNVVKEYTTQIYYSVLESPRTHSSAISSEAVSPIQDDAYDITVSNIRYKMTNSGSNR